MIDPRQLPLEGEKESGRARSAPKKPSVQGRIAVLESVCDVLLGHLLDRELSDADRARVLATQAMLLRAPQGDI